MAQGWHAGAGIRLCTGDIITRFSQNSSFMPKRKFRERRQEDSEEEQQELENVLAEVAIPERTRTKGVSVSAAHEGVRHGTEICVSCFTRWFVRFAHSLD